MRVCWHFETTDGARRVGGDSVRRGKRDISLIVSISFAFYLVYLLLHGVRAPASY